MLLTNVFACRKLLGTILITHVLVLVEKNNNDNIPLDSIECSPIFEGPKLMSKKVVRGARG
jgi:hypothetical protein